ncbi:MAG: queuosine precursor transporter [Spirochaetaceae bacterium]|nr:queuosine precursor transporter [Spirochaetaceae bacterium]
MSNELLWFIVLLVNFVFILSFYRILGKLGLYLWMPIAVIFANIEVIKTVEIFGVTATLGNIIFATSFLATDILSENYSKKDAYRAVLVGFMVLIVMSVLMTFAIQFAPAESDFAHEHLKAIFSLMPRIALASVIAFLISQTHDVWAYHFWKKRFPAVKYIWIRNNASTIVSQLIDSTIFCLVAFVGIFSGRVLVEIIITTYLMKIMVSVCDTPCVYIAERWFRKGKIKEVSLIASE